MLPARPPKACLSSTNLQPMETTSGDVFITHHGRQDSFKVATHHGGAILDKWAGELLGKWDRGGGEPSVNPQERTHNLSRQATWTSSRFRGPLIRVVDLWNTTPERCANPTKPRSDLNSFGRALDLPRVGMSCVFGLGT